MKWIIVFGLLALSACNDDSREKNSPVTDSTGIQPAPTFIDTLDIADSSNTVIGTPENDDKETSRWSTPSLIREGKHNFTLHWISWDHPGKVTITRIGDSLYSVEGKQLSRTNDDYINIEGELKAMDRKMLVFEGEIRYRVETNNGGEPCVKKGPLHFQVTQNRQYWRLQEMNNCEGGGLVDYIDIYFK